MTPAERADRILRIIEEVYYPKDVIVGSGNEYRVREIRKRIADEIRQAVEKAGNRKRTTEFM